MKKTIAISLAAVASLGLAACAETETAAEEETTEEAEADMEATADEAEADMEAMGEDMEAMGDEAMNEASALTTIKNTILRSVPGRLQAWSWPRYAAEACSRATKPRAA